MRNESSVQCEFGFSLSELMWTVVSMKIMKTFFNPLFGTGGNQSLNWFLPDK